MYIARLVILMRERAVTPASILRYSRSIHLWQSTRACLLLLRLLLVICKAEFVSAMEEANQTAPLGKTGNNHALSIANSTLNMSIPLFPQQLKHRPKYSSKGILGTGRSFPTKAKGQLKRQPQEYVEQISFIKAP